MESNIKGTAIIIMGVCGSGKSTIGALLGDALNCKFLDADDFHSQSNKEKMQRGEPLTDEDRVPWLERLRDVLRAYIKDESKVVLGCSSLTQRYREILRSADPNCNRNNHGNAINFVFLDAKREMLTERLKKRANHFMPVELLQSQLDLIRIEESERIFRVDASLSPSAIVKIIVSSIDIA